MTADTFNRAGLPRDTVAAWLGSGGALHGDYGRDSENFSRQWRIGAELIAKLPRNWEQMNMEAVIETQVIQGHPGPPNILAVETW